MKIENNTTGNEGLPSQQSITASTSRPKTNEFAPTLPKEHSKRIPSTTRRILQVSGKLVEIIRAALENISTNDLQKGGVTPKPPLKRLEPSSHELVEGRLPENLYRDAIEKCQALFLKYEMQSDPGIELQIAEDGQLIESSQEKRIPKSQRAQQGLFMYYADILQEYLDEEHLEGPIRVEESPLGTIVQNGGEPLFLCEVFSRYIKSEDVNALIEAKKDGAMCLPIIAPEILESEPEMGGIVYLVAESLDRAVNKCIAKREDVLRRLPGYVFADFEFIELEEGEEPQAQDILEMTIDQDNSSGQNPPQESPKLQMHRGHLEVFSMRGILDYVSNQFSDHQNYLHDSLNEYTPQNQRRQDKYALARHLPSAGTNRQHRIREMLEVLVPRLYADMLDAHALLVSAVMAHLDQEPYNVEGMYDDHTLATALGKYGVGGLKGRVLKDLQRYDGKSEASEQIMTEDGLNLLEELTIHLSFPKGPQAAAASALLYKNIRIEEHQPLRFEMSEVIEQAGNGKDEPDSLDHIARIYIGIRRLLEKAPETRGSQGSITWLFWKLTGHMQTRKIIMNGNESETHTPLLRGRLHDILSILYQHAHPEASESNFLIELLIDIIEKPASVWNRDGLFNKYVIKQQKSLKPRTIESDEQAFVDWYDRRMNKIQNTTTREFRDIVNRAEWAADIAQEIQGFTVENATIAQASTEWLIRSHEQLSAEMSQLVLTKIRKELPETLRIFGYEGIAMVVKVVSKQVQWVIASSF